MDTRVDTTGLSCPQPMLMVKKAMEQLKNGSITVLADAEASRENISRAAKSMGWEKTLEQLDNGIFTMVFSKQA